MSESSLTGSPKWFRDQIAEYARLVPQLRRFADELGRILQSAADELAPEAIIQTRVKVPASFAQKALLKQYDYPVCQFTDLCGGRVIARTRREVEAMAGFVEQAFTIDRINSVDASQRLHPTEFGYRSIHYIVSLNPETNGSESPGGNFEFECGKCKTWHPLKAEVQLRTTVEHAWSDFTHDLSYKGAFELPSEFEREIAVIAAGLEDVDRAFQRVEKDLRVYSTNYGTHLTTGQLGDRMAQLGMVLEIDQSNAQLGWEMGNLAIVAGDWDRARDVLGPFVNVDDPESAYQPLLRDLGRVLCHIHDDNAEFSRGQRYLTLAAAPRYSDTYALALLADTWRGIDADKARELYRQAFELDPTEAYPLVRYLEYEIGSRDNTGILDMMGPLADRAVDRCAAQASVGINLPWAHYGKAELLLFTGKPYEALDFYARAINKSTGTSAIEEALEGVKMLAKVPDPIVGVDWIVDLLTVALMTRLPTDDATATIAHQANDRDLHTPVVMVVGGTALELEADMRQYRRGVVDAFNDFEGTLISGGTRNGVAGFVGEVGEGHADRIVAVGYAPESSAFDDRYTRLHLVGDGFSPQQNLQSWIDLIVAGVDPADVKVLGINGGEIAMAEYHIALALGATVGLVRDSGRAVDAILNDAEWAKAGNLLALPYDPQTLRSFVGIGSPKLPPTIRDRLAEKIHCNHCDAKAKDQEPSDPSQAVWAELAPTFKESNRLQADHIEAKLRQIGCEIVPIGDEMPPFEFIGDEVELLAEMEHGRWNAARLADGWVLGEQKDAENKISPYLVAWADLPDHIRKSDRDPVESILGLLDSEGLAIRRIE